ncbi:hypothetical protein Syun_025544 [Stephania yunnanensis]|uniref:Uncharacterized protein n=1 Tax=Stephania yunnanensis TaxID=152371 RepID=A0AAP0F0R7_9MAGN
MKLSAQAVNEVPSLHAQAYRHSASFDLILGMAWLNSLGITTNDWPNLTMYFQFEGKPRVLQAPNHWGFCFPQVTSLYPIVHGQGVLLEAEPSLLWSVQIVDLY